MLGLVLYSVSSIAFAGSHTVNQGSFVGQTAAGSTFFGGGTYLKGITDSGSNSNVAIITLTPKFSTGSSAGSPIRVSQLKLAASENDYYDGTKGGASQHQVYDELSGRLRATWYTEAYK